MYARCKSALLPLLLLLSVNAPYLSAASIRWVHLGTIDAGLVNLAINGKIVYRKMPPGKATSWGNILPGLHKFQIGTETVPGNSFEMEITAKEKIVIVSVSDKNGDIQSRSVTVDAAKGGAFILNAMYGTMFTLPETEQKAIFGKGFRVPVAKQNSTVSFADAEGLKGELILSLLAAEPKDPYLVILSADDDGKPQVSILRERDSLFETSDELLEIPGEISASVRIISPRNTPGEGAFDPSLVKWDQVESQIFWLNMMIGRDPCRLEIGGFPAMRRMPSGRGSGFVKWPAGGWKTALVVEATNEKLDASNFSLSPKSSIGLISSGGGKFPARLIAVEGRPRVKSSEAANPQIRFVNALPAGVVRSVIPKDPEAYTLALEPGETSEVIPLGKAGFPGAALNFTLGETNSQKISDIPQMPSIPSGDWVVVIHLDQESFAAPVLTWVEMDKGSIISPASAASEEE